MVVKNLVDFQKTTDAGHDYTVRIPDHPFSPDFLDGILDEAGMYAGTCVRLRDDGISLFEVDCCQDYAVLKAITPGNIERRVCGILVDKHRHSLIGTVYNYLGFLEKDFVKEEFLSGDSTIYPLYSTVLKPLAYESLLPYHDRRFVDPEVDTGYLADVVFQASRNYERNADIQSFINQFWVTIGANPSNLPGMTSRLFDFLTYSLVDDDPDRLYNPVNNVLHNIFEILRNGINPRILYPEDHVRAVMFDYAGIMDNVVKLGSMSQDAEKYVVDQLSEGHEYFVQGIMANIFGHDTIFRKYDLVCDSLKRRKESRITIPGLKLSRDILVRSH